MTNILFGAVLVLLLLIGAYTYLFDRVVYDPLEPEIKRRRAERKKREAKK